MNLDRAASLIASGVKPAQVATVVGVSPARISQLMKEEPFLLKVKAFEAEMDVEDAEEQSITAKYAAAEHALLGQMIDLLPSAELRDVTAALRVVAERQEKAKTRQLPQTPASQNNNLTIVSLNLPVHALPSVPAVQMNEQGEVIAIGEQSLAPLGATGVTNLFQKMKRSVERTIEGGISHEQSPSIASPKEGTAEAAPEEESFLSYAAAH